MFSAYFITGEDKNESIYYWTGAKAKPLDQSCNVNPLVLCLKNIVKPFNWDNIQQVSYDLTLFRVFEIVGKGSIIGNKTSLPEYKQLRLTKGTYKLKAGKAYAFDFCEKVEVPDNMFATVLPRSSLNRMGSLLSSGVYDPGFKNRIGATVRIFQNDIELERFNRVATILFQWAKPHSSYEGQWQGKV